MSSTLNLQPLSAANALSFDPNIHFAIPEIIGVTVTLTGDGKDTLRTLRPESADAKLYTVANVLRQGSCRVDATIRAVNVVHEQLRRNIVVSPTFRMEAETALLTFVDRVKEKVAKNLYGPFALIRSQMWGGLGRLTAIQSTLTTELHTSTLAAQSEQILCLSPHCAIMTDKEAAIAVKKALTLNEHTQKGFLLRMDADKPSLFHLVVGARRRNEVDVCNVQESVIILREGKYTLKIDPFDPQHASFAESVEVITATGEKKIEKKNEWKSSIHLMSALRAKYGTALLATQEAIPALSAPSELSAAKIDVTPADLPPPTPAAITQAADTSLTRPVTTPPAVPPASGGATVQPQPASALTLSLDQLPPPSVSISAPVSPSSGHADPVRTYLMRASSEPPAELAPAPKLPPSATIDTLQKAIDSGLCDTRVGSIGVSSALRKHALTLNISKVGPVNFMLHTDITQALYIDLLHSTSVGEFSEDFNYKQLDFEIIALPNGKYRLSDRDADANNKWPYSAKQWNSFGSMMQYFLTNCGTPINAPRVT